MANIKGIITAVILAVVAIIVVFNLVGSSATDLTDASDNISGSGLPYLYKVNSV